MFRPTGSILQPCRIGVAAVGVLLTVVYGPRVSSGSEGAPTVPSGGSIALPAPRVDGELSVEQALVRRRSLRKFAHAPLPLSAVSQLLWAAQGITHPDGMRTAPSAGALYPLEVYLVAGAVMGLEPGVYHYQPSRHQLVLVTEGDVRVGVARAALGQDWISEAPAILVLGAVYERTERKYRQRTARYVHIESGHAAQNVYLQAEALGLGTTIVGAFHDGDLTRVVGLPGRVKPLALLPVGRPR
jgi:SagB-type dehydrogenase family enzyme